MCNHIDEYSITAILCWTAHCQCNTHISAYWSNAVLMLARRLRRRPNINTALGQRIVFVGHRQVWYKNSVSCDSVSAALYITVILVWVSEPEYNNNGDVVMATEVTSVPDGCDSDHHPPPPMLVLALPAQHKTVLFAGAVKHVNLLLYTRLCLSHYIISLEVKGCIYNTGTLFYMLISKVPSSNVYFFKFHACIKLELQIREISIELPFLTPVLLKPV